MEVKFLCRLLRSYRHFSFLSTVTCKQIRKLSFMPASFVFSRAPWMAVNGMTWRCSHQIGEKPPEREVKRLAQNTDIWRSGLGNQWGYFAHQNFATQSVCSSTLLMICLAVVWRVSVLWGARAVAAQPPFASKWGTAEVKAYKHPTGKISFKTGKWKLWLMIYLQKLWSVYEWFMKGEKETK